MKLNVAIQMDHVSTIDIDGDSTFVLALEAQHVGGVPLRAWELAELDGAVIVEGAVAVVDVLPAEPAA